MFGGLRKKLNDVWSGADFWDEEENRAQRVQAAKPTVQTRPVQAPKAPPVRTVNARQNNQRAIDQSYGTGFDRFVNKSRDMFDANTQADRIRRFATTGIDESYDQQQRKQTIAAQTNPKKRSLLEQVGYNVMGAQAEIAKVPSASQKLVGTALKSDNPIIKMGTSKFLDQNPFTGSLNSIDTVLPGSKKTAGKALQSFGANNEKLITNKLEQSRFGQKESDNKLVAGVSRALGQLSSQIGANVVAPGSGAAIGSVPLASSEYDKAKQSGKTDDQALGIAGLQGTVAAGLEQVGLGRLGKGAGTRLVKGLRNFATEGSTEGIQQFGQNLVANKAYNPNQGLTEGVKESVLYGGIAGGVAGSVMGGNKPKRPTTNLAPKPTRTRLRPEEARIWSDYQETLYKGNRMPAQVVNETHNKARQIADSLGVDIITGSPDEIAGRMNPLLEQSMAFQKEPTTSLVSRAKGMITPLNQGGYIQLGAPEPKKLSQDIKDQFSKQGSFGRDAMDRLEANKISKGDLERAGVIFDPKQVKKIAQTLPEFKDNPVMTYRKGDYRYMSDNGRYRSTPDVAESGTFEFKHKDGVMRLNPEALFGKEMAQKLAQTAKDGEQVDFTDTMKASGNRLFTYDQTADIPTPTVAKPVQKQVTEKQNSVDPLESLNQEAKPATGARSDYSPENLQANRQIRAKNASSITYADKKTINPDELVTVYRAVPGKAKGGLVEGDWVTPNKEQARLFMKQSWAQDDTGAKIVTKKVKASELRYHADDAKGYVDDELLYVPKATQSQPPKSTAKAAESKTPLEVEQELDKFYGRGGDQEFLSSVIKKYESKMDGKKSIAEMMNPEERARYDQIFSGSSSEQPAQRTNESNKGVVLSEATLADGTKQQKVLGAPGEGKVKTSSPLSDQAYKEVFGSDINVDSEPRFDAVAAGSKSNSTKRLMEAISQDEMLTQAAAQAQQDGKEINFFAKKDRNGRSVGIERFDPRYHKIEAGFVTDKNGNVLGNHIKVDETGMQVNVGGDVVNMDTVLGNPQDWEGHYEMSSTMERNIYENAPNKEIADKTYKFVVANKIKHEAELKTDLANQRKALNERTRATLKAKPRGVSKKEYKADVFDFIEGNMSQSDLVGKYGPQTSQQIISYRNDTRRLYDTLLDRVNTTFEQFGEASVPRRKDYITHINELISKPSFAGELYGQLQNSFLGEGQTQTRGEVPANIAGRTENFEPRKKWNRFFQARRGGEFTKDPFKAVDAYLEPTLYNIHMTEPAVRARAVEAAFRTAREIKETDTKHLTDEFNTSLDKYKSGNGGGDLVTGFQEYANAVTGKTQRLDRQIIDQGSKSRLALHGWQKLQAIGGRATILGNVSSVLAQPLNQVGTVAQSGPINYMKGLAASVGGDKTIEQSPFITARRTKVDSMFKSRGQKVLDAGGVPLQLVEMASVEQSWNAIHQKVKSEGYTGKDAILETDRRTERTVAGRGIADKPELYRSTVYNGVLQYTLEVNASNKQFWRDLNPRQKATFLVASTGMNMLMEAVTGYEPLPDFLGAMIDTAGDFLDEEDDASALGKGARGVQRMFGEYVSQNPIASATANILPQNLRKDIFGKDAQVSRFEGTAAPVQVVKNVVNAGSSLAKGQLTNARDSALKVAPFGNQAKKTITGTEMLARGYAVNAKGEKTFDAPTSPVGKGKALLFGPNSSGEARQYYDKKNGVTKSSTPSKTSGDLGEYGDVKNVLKAQFDTKEGREFLAMNAAEKKEAAKNDTGIRQMYEQYNTTKRVNKASPDRPAGLAKNYETFLNGHAKRTPEQRERLAYSQNDYDLKLAEAKYEEDKLKGKVSRAEKINRDYTIKKAQVGAKFSKDVRESYNSLSKAELTALAESDPNGQKIWDDAVAYGDALVEAGLLKKNKLKTKSKGGGKGRRKGKGRGGKGGRGGKRASKYDYTKDLFGSGGNIDSNNNTKALRAILAKAMSGKS